MLPTGRPQEGCQVIQKETCPRGFPTRSQVTLAERGWILGHQTLKPGWGVLQRRHSPLCGSSDGGPQTSPTPRGTTSRLQLAPGGKTFPARPPPAPPLQGPEAAVSGQGRSGQGKRENATTTLDETLPSHVSLNWTFYYPVPHNEGKATRVVKDEA